MVKKIILDAILKPSPEKELVELAKLASDGGLIDWKSAIVMAAMYLKRFGLERLFQYFTAKKIPLGKGKLEKMNLNEAAILLFGLGLIEQREFNVIDEIWKERNQIIHRLNMDVLTENYNPRLNSEANKKFGKMINDAMDVISSLKKSSK